MVLPIWLDSVFAACYEYSMSIMRHYLTFFVLLALLLLQGCAKVPYTDRTQTNMMSSESELAMGRSASNAVLSRLRTCREKEMSFRVKRIGKQLVEHAGYNGFEWRFYCIEDWSFNAMAFPGGTIAINSGVLRTADNDDQVASVVGHEMGHVIARHGAERYTKAMITQVAVAILGAGAAVAVGGDAGTASDMSAVFGILAQYGLLLPFSRENEYEADKLGMFLMAKAGYDPAQAAALWQKVVDKNPNPKKGDFLSTHPADVKRLAAMRELAPQALAYKTGGEKAGASGLVAAAPEGGDKAKAQGVAAAISTAGAGGHALAATPDNAPDGASASIPPGQKDSKEFNRGLMP